MAVVLDIRTEHPVAIHLRSLEPALRETRTAAAYLSLPTTTARRELQVSVWVGLLFHLPTPKYFQSQILLVQRLKESLGRDDSEVVVLNDQTEQYVADRLPYSLRVYCSDPERVNRWEERHGLTRRPLSEYRSETSTVSLPRRNL